MLAQEVAQELGTVLIPAFVGEALELVVQVFVEREGGAYEVGHGDRTVWSPEAGEGGTAGIAGATSPRRHVATSFFGVSLGRSHHRAKLKYYEYKIRNTDSEVHMPQFKLSRTLLLIAAGSPLMAADVVTPPPAPPVSEALPTIVVQGRQDDLVGIAATASEGTTGREQLQWRPLLRPGELLETVPGLIATQHSGTGKANQYFLRGFNLDHGTDFATSVDGMPVNMPTHGHGQGYTDVNFLIPELVDNVTYWKGPYHAAIGDFSAAGGAHIALADTLPANTVGVTIGTDAYIRGLATGNIAVGEGRLVYGLEALGYDGPWVNDENLLKGNGVLRYVNGDQRNGWNVTLMGYGSEWDSTDQIPSRAVEDGTIDRLGAIDPTTGGESSRFSLSGGWHAGDQDQQTRVSLYAIAYRMNLWSNFTYFEADPVNGDQFEQVDRRTIVGGEATHRWLMEAGGVQFDTTAGVQIRTDLISEVGLHQTVERDRIGTVRSDEVQEYALGAFVSSTIFVTEWFRAVPGFRADLYHFDVEAEIPENTGTESDAIASPKLALVFGPWKHTELSVAGGLGFHSNDARGTTTTIDPNDGVTPLAPVDPLVRSTGAEIGVRTSVVEGLRSSVTLWWLEIDSELLFIGDAGTTEATRPSARWGIEWSNYWRVTPWLDLDLDYAWTQAEFTDEDPAGDYIPGSPEQIVGAGVTVHHDGWFASLRLRYFGPRPLIEDDSVRSDSTTLVNLGAGYTWKQLAFTVEVLNLFDSEDHDIDYYYASQLATEGAPVDDIHYHPVEPFGVRGGVAYTF